MIWGFRVSVVTGLLASGLDFLRKGSCVICPNKRNHFGTGLLRLSLICIWGEKLGFCKGSRVFFPNLIHTYILPFIVITVLVLYS